MKHTFYFQHDYNARNDPKLQEILIEYGAAGIGAFWCIVEQLYEQEGKLPIKSYKSIAFALHLECNIIRSVVEDFNLFKNDGVFFWSDSVLCRLKKRKTISERRKKAATSRWESIRAKQKHSKSNANAKQKQCKVYAKEIYNISLSNSNNDIDNNREEEIGGVGERDEKSSHFVPPTIEEVSNHIKEKGYSIDPESFVAFYDSKGWMVGKNKMKSWKSALTTWEKRSAKEKTSYERKRHTGLSRISSSTEGAYEGDL